MKITYLTLGLIFLYQISFAEPQIFKSIGAKVIEERDLGSLMEYVIGKNGRKMIVYETKDGKYLIIGALLDAKSGKNLTKERYKEINKVGFSKIPLDEALHIRFGKGGKKLVMISDPECPFCRRAHRYLKEKNVDLYVFLFPLDIHPNAYKKSVKILCFKDKAKAYDEALSGKEINAKECKKGENLLKKHILIGQMLGVRGTPLFVKENGEKIEGFVVSELEEYLGGNKNE
ncbi:MAG TPA: DsbC family protein [Aquifex aeolicus]|nr:DsbC family protein [Aquifex aeolicus]